MLVGGYRRSLLRGRDGGGRTEASRVRSGVCLRGRRGLKERVQDWGKVQEGICV